MASGSPRWLRRVLLYGALVFLLLLVALLLVLWLGGGSGDLAYRYGGFD
jgi:hypothetical protein